MGAWVEMSGLGTVLGVLAVVYRLVDSVGGLMYVQGDPSGWRWTESESLSPPGRTASRKYIGMK